MKIYLHTRDSTVTTFWPSPVYLASFALFLIGVSHREPHGLISGQDTLYLEGEIQEAKVKYKNISTVSTKEGATMDD